jgi:hypothetical protein
VKLGLVLTILIALAPEAWALPDFGSVGTAGADFLKIPSATRAAGMAGAVAASAEGLESLEYNPARLSSVLGWELSAQHLSYAEGIALEQGALGWGRPGLGLGLAVLSLNTPAIPSTDISGAQIGTFKQQDLAVSAGLGWEADGFSMGVLGRGLQRSLAGYSYSGGEADLGAAWRSQGGWRLGLAAQHLGSLSAMAKDADPSPMSFRGGLGWGYQSPDGFSFNGELDGVQPRGTAPQGRLGLEMGWSYFFARAGAQVSQAYDGRQPFTMGAGIRFSSWQLDYSFADLQGLGTAHRFGLNWRLDGAYGGRKGLKAPQGLAVVKNGNDLLLSWQGTENASGYAVYLRKGQDVPINRAGKTKAKQTTLRLKNAAKLPHLGMAVATLGEDDQESPLSDELRVQAGQEKAQTVPKPVNLKVLVEKGQRVLLWDMAGQEGEFSYQVLVSRRSGSGYAPLGKPTLQREKELPGPDEWKESRFVVVQALREGAKGQESSALSDQVDILVR